LRGVSENPRGVLGGRIQKSPYGGRGGGAAQFAAFCTPGFMMTVASRVCWRRNPDPVPGKAESPAQLLSSNILWPPCHRVNRPKCTEAKIRSSGFARRKQGRGRLRSLNRGGNTEKANGTEVSPIHSAKPHWPNGRLPAEKEPNRPSGQSITGRPFKALPGMAGLGKILAFRRIPPTRGALKFPFDTKTAQKAA